jgi:hypothetical protein
MLIVLKVTIGQQVIVGQTLRIIILLFVAGFLKIQLVGLVEVS